MNRTVARQGKERICMTANDAKYAKEKTLRSFPCRVVGYFAAPQIQTVQDEEITSASSPVKVSQTDLFMFFEINDLGFRRRRCPALDRKPNPDLQPRG